jgi:hypothetical protein
MSKKAYSTPCCGAKMRLNDGQHLVACKCGKVWNAYTARGVTHWKEQENAS